jgi:hypothetical protein
MVPIAEGASSLAMHKLSLFLTVSLFSLFITANLMAQGTCPSNVPAGVTKCYFIDYAGGSDASNGTSESTPWQHAPGFANVTGIALAHAPSAGEGWIFKGGVVVDFHAWPANVPWGGTAPNPTYIGVDRAWYTGTSWSRPIFNGGGASGYAADTRGMLTDVAHRTGNFIIDSIEFTGLYWVKSCGGDNSPACSYLATYNGSTTSDTWEAKNLYVHGWSHGPSNTQTPGSYQALVAVGNSGTQATQGSVHDSVFDGFDSSKDCCAAILATNIYNNYITYVSNSVYQSVNNAPMYVQVHDNTIVYNASQQGINPDGSGTSTSDAHPNCYHTWGLQAGYVFVYNNLIACQYSQPAYETETSLFEHDNATGIYIFNNVLISGRPDGIPLSSFQAGGGTSVYYAFNNTFEGTLDPNPGGTCFTLGGQSTATLADNFCITNNWWSTVLNPTLKIFTGSVHSLPSPTFSINCGRGLQSNFGASQICAPIGSGNGAGNLNASQSYPFAPMDSTAAAKVGAGQNNAALCSAVSTINAAAGSACLSDTSLGVAYDAANHTVSWPRRPPVPRPTGTANWTNGAYEAGSGSSSSVSPPSGLAAIVN